MCAIMWDARCICMHVRQRRIMSVAQDKIRNGPAYICTQIYVWETNMHTKSIIKNKPMRNSSSIPSSSFPAPETCIQRMTLACFSETREREMLGAAVAQPTWDCQRRAPCPHRCCSCPPVCSPPQGPPLFQSPPQTFSAWPRVDEYYFLKNEIAGKYKS